MNPLQSSSAQWPITMTISNDPITGIVEFSQQSPLGTDLYTASYLSSFKPHRGMSIYMMTDGVDESFGLYAIQIALQCTKCQSLGNRNSSENIAANSPSNNPSNSPSNNQSDVAINGMTSNSNDAVFSLNSSGDHGEDARIASIIMGVIGAILCLCVGLLMHFCFLSQRRDSYDFDHRPKRTKNHRKYSGMRRVKRERDFIPSKSPEVDLKIINGNAIGKSNGLGSGSRSTAITPSGAGISPSRAGISPSRVTIIRNTHYDPYGNDAMDRITVQSTSPPILDGDSPNPPNPANLANVTNSIDLHRHRRDYSLKRHLDLNRIHGGRHQKMNSNSNMSNLSHLAQNQPNESHLNHPQHLNIDSGPSATSATSEPTELSTVTSATPDESVSDQKVGRDLIKEGERMTNEAMKQLYVANRARLRARSANTAVKSFGNPINKKVHGNGPGKLGKISVKKKSSYSSKYSSKYARNRGHSVDRMTSQLSNTTSLMVRGRTESGDVIMNRYGQQSGTMGTVVLHDMGALHENVSSINSVDYHKLRTFLDHMDEDVHDGHDDGALKVVDHNSDARSTNHGSHTTHDQDTHENHGDFSTSSDEHILEKSERTPFRMDV